MRPQETGTAMRINDTKRRAPKFVFFSQHYELTPREGNKLSGSQEFPTFHGTCKFIAVCTRTHHLSQTWDTLIQAMPCHFISLRSLPTLTSHLQLLLTGVLSVIYRPTYFSFIGVSAKLPEPDSGMAGCEVRTVLTVLCIMYGTHCRYTHVMLCTESVKTDEEGRKRQVAWERGDTGRDPAQWLCPQERQPTFIIRTTWQMYIRVESKDAPMFTKHNILKEWGTGGYSSMHS